MATKKRNDKKITGDWPHFCFLIDFLLSIHPEKKQTVHIYGRKHGQTAELAQDDWLESFWLRKFIIGTRLQNNKNPFCYFLLLVL